MLNGSHDGDGDGNNTLDAERIGRELREVMRRVDLRDATTTAELRKIHDDLKETRAHAGALHTEAMQLMTQMHGDVCKRFDRLERMLGRRKPKSGQPKPTAKRRVKMARKAKVRR